MKKYLKLDLGCGSKPYKDYTGIDIGFYSNRIIQSDALSYLKKLKKSSVSHIYSRHYLEHSSPEQLLSILNEINRVAIVGAEIIIIVPHFSNPYFYSDPTHKTFFGVHTFSYFCEFSVLGRAVPKYSTIKGLNLTDVKINFVPRKKRILGVKLPFLCSFLNFFINLNVGLIERYERYFCYLFSIYEVEFIIKKALIK